MVIKSLNQAMDIDISKFVVVNFKAVADLVDAVGGITVDVQDVEIQQLNKYTIQTAENIGKKNYKLVEQAGEQTLEGVQAVSYGRIRKGVGDDFKRTERMRVVLSLVFEKLKTMSIGELDDMLDMMLPQVKTNLSNSDMLGLASRLIDFNIKSGAGWPYYVTGGYINGVSYVFPDDLAANTKELHEKMFGQADYEPTETVQNISSTIASTVNGSTVEPKDLDLPETTDIGGGDTDQNTGPNGSGEKKDDENNGGGSTAKPTPDPEPEPEPEPTPTPEPEPTPEPTPTPEPEPAPTPDSGADAAQS